MSLSQRLDLKQTQQLRMTPQLTQAIALLQLSASELLNRVAEEVDKNPILDLDRSRPVSGGLAPTGGEDFDRAASVAEAITLRAHLLSQLGGLRAKRDTLSLAMALVDELNADGRLTAPLFEIADRYGVMVGKVEQALALVQSCDPAGVGARSLGECFALQLDERGMLDPAMREICTNLADIAGPGRAELIARTALDKEAFEARLALLRDLDPRPGQAFAQDATAPTVVPDVIVRRLGQEQGGGWQVELNSETLPRVLVNDIYASEVSASGEEAARFISNCKASASWLVRALEQRAHSILKVSEALLRHQRAFFEQGEIALLPLSMAHLAEGIGVHESTVSRVVANKYITTPHGMRELRSFFSQGVTSTSRTAGFAAGAVHARLRKLIAQEDRALPLSDEALVLILREDGVDIARRTVAKYRDVMGIPSSVQRRRLNSVTRG
jgi:RNA polymerase sigma-54 factor